jgi:hypothetical protein
MKVRALRGVCIGVGKHLAPGETADLDAATVQFLVSVGAVEKVEPSPPAPAAEPTPTTEATPASGTLADDGAAKVDSKSTPAKSGNKEK